MSKQHRKSIAIYSFIAVGITVIFASLGLAPSAFGIPLCWSVVTQPAPCNGFTRTVGCPYNCTFTNYGYAKTQCGTISSGCCQWTEEFVACSGTECMACVAAYQPTSVAIFLPGYFCVDQHTHNGDWHCAP